MNKKIYTKELSYSAVDTDIPANLAIHLAICCLLNGDVLSTSSFYFLSIVDSKRSMVLRTIIPRPIIIYYYYYLEKDRIR